MNIYNAISDFCWLQHGGYLYGLICCLSAVLRLLHGLLFPKVFFKSDTAVALRRSISLILCITLVSYIKVYDDYFCKLMWLSANSPDVWGKTLLNITRQCKLRFMDRNLNFIEQNIHVLCNMKSYECHLMKIIKGKWIFIMLIMTSVDFNMADICLACFGLWAPYSDYCMVCLSRKVF